MRLAATPGACGPCGPSEPCSCQLCCSICSVWDVLFWHHVHALMFIYGAVRAEIATIIFFPLTDDNSLKYAVVCVVQHVNASHHLSHRNIDAVKNTVWFRDVLLKIAMYDTLKDGRILGLTSCLILTKLRWKMALLIFLMGSPC